jgi:cbb3-type cytochrome oxidase subunit 3
MPDFHTAFNWLQLHSIIWMTAVFSLIALTTYWPGRRASLERNGSIPMRDDE